MAKAITYRTGEQRGALRTVIVEDAKTSIILLPTGRLEIMTGQLLHGTTCRKESLWDGVLGQDHDDDTFSVPRAQVVRVREMTIAVKARHHK